jgi:hypothetical protein
MNFICTSVYLWILAVESYRETQSTTTGAGMQFERTCGGSNVNINFILHKHSHFPEPRLHLRRVSIFLSTNQRPSKAYPRRVNEDLHQLVDSLW